MEWLALLEALLPIAVLISTALTIFIFTLPKPYSNFEPLQISASDFNDGDKSKENASRSGYAYYQTHKDENGLLQPRTSVHIIVLGDIGRSPRMQYHALSLASHGAQVSLIGYADSDPHPDITASRFVTLVPILPFPTYLQTSSKLLFLALAPLKVLHQIWSLYSALGYRTRAAKWMLVQNPPSIPTLAVAQAICFLRNTRLVIDWHNFGYTILALRLGASHPLVRLSEWFEGFFSRSATAHFSVTHAMARVLKSKWNITALPLHDRPPLHFQPLSPPQRLEFLRTLPETKPHFPSLKAGKSRLLLSSTSWTPDEDFSLLLSALQTYASLSTTNPRLALPALVVIITGKGPQKAHYISLISRLTTSGKLPNITILTAWLSAADYASLLASADLGISLHTSSSGVDLPMKVVDMFGAGLPVAGWDRFEAWPELVTEGVSGRGFGSSEGLADVLVDLFGKDGRGKLEGLREGALREGEKRWEGEWMSVAGKVFGVE